MDPRRTRRPLGSPNRRRWLATFAILGLLALQGRFASAADLPTNDDEGRTPNVRLGQSSTEGSVEDQADTAGEGIDTSAVSADATGSGGGGSRRQGNAVAPAKGVQSLATTEPRHVQLTLEGCRGSVGTSFPATGPFICPEAEYTTGNLGKGWNELDRVPHRLTTQLGTQAAATTTYDVAIVADYLEGGKPGYDRISVPVVNDAKSDDSCAVTVGDQQVATPGVGGTDSSIYRVLTITQDKGTTCVFDWNERLALGSHLFPGSSLHSNVTQADLTTGGIGARDVSIPVKEILPQELSKRMRATQGVGFVWDIDKATQPGRISFGDTCAPGAPLTREVTVTVSWTKEQLPTGDVRIHTEITATNPAHRPIDVQITDTIYVGADQSTEANETSGENPKTFPVTRVDAGGSVTVEHTITVASGTTFNDVATAVYTDPVEPDVQIPGQTEARASATVETIASDENATVVITDTEDIEGGGLSFSVDDVSGASGSFAGGYALGTETSDPVTWISDAQSGNGSVTFAKTVSLDGPRQTEGQLSDTAQVLGDDEQVLDKASASVDITADATVRLTIEKSIPAGILTGDETQDFVFDVTGPDGFSDTVILSFSAGETSESTTLTGLEPGTYTVDEQLAAGWQPPGPPVAVDLNLPTCSGTASFENRPVGASAAVRKITVPEGGEAGWTFTLTGPGLPGSGEIVTTGPDGTASFTTTLQEGTYTITETSEPDYEQTGIELDGRAVESCSFTVDLPADAGHTFTCTFTNTLLQPDITVTKQGSGTVSAGDAVSFTITVTNLGPGTAHGVTLTDALPSGFEWEIVSLDGSAPGEGAPCGISEGVLTCDFGDMDPEESHSVTISSLTEASDCGEHRNTATVSADNEALGGEAPNEASDSVTVLCAGIDVQKTPDGGTVQAGDPITFTITVTNLGPGDAKGVTLEDHLPAGLDWQISGGTGAESCSIRDSVLTCDFGTMPAPSEGEPSVLTVEVTATTATDDCGLVDNQATVRTTNNGSDSDTGQVTVQCPTPPPPPSPSPSPTPSPSPPAISVDLVKVNDADEDGTFTDDETANEQGQDVTFRVTITNTSSVNVVIQSLTDQWPGQAPFPVSCDEGNLVGTVLSPGRSVTCTFTIAGYAPVTGDAPGSVVDTAAVTVGQQGNESNAASDQDDSTVRVEAVLGETVTPPAETTTPPGGVAFTGAEVTRWGLLALALLLAGSGLLWLSWRSLGEPEA